MEKKDEIRKSETFVNYDAEGKKIIRIYSFMRKVKKNEPNVEDNVFKKLKENSKNLKEYFPTYPFRSGLQKADGFLHYSPMCEKSLIESIGGFQLHLTQAELAIIDKTVGSRELSDIKCFLIQKCNNQNTKSLSWNDILENLKFWLKQTNSQRKTASGKAGETKQQKHKKTLEGEWSNPMTKSAMMSRVNIDGYKKFNTFAKQYGLQKAGNRQLWQIRLDKMDKNTRQKFEKA